MMYIIKPKAKFIVSYRIATQRPSAADRTLSCPEVATRLDNLYARYEEIDRQQRARANQAALVDGLLGVGTHLVGGQLLRTRRMPQSRQTGGASIYLAGIGGS